MSAFEKDKYINYQVSKVASITDLITIINLSARSALRTTSKLSDSGMSLLRVSPPRA